MTPKFNRGGTGEIVRVAAAMLLFVAVLLAGIERPAFAAEGPFAGLAGAWSGGGSVSLPNGAHERIRCRASYAVSSSGNNLQQSLRCASDSYHFDLRSNVNAHGGAISGFWSESTRSLNGQVSGRIRGGQINALVEANGFSATITIMTHGDRQSVSIRSLSHQLAGATMSLSRH